jgi:hypothetical protein
MKNQLQLLKLNNFVLFIYACVAFAPNLYIFAKNTAINKQLLQNKLKTQFENNGCPVEYESVCKCKSDTDLSLNSLSIRVICSLNKNDANRNLKIIPRINVTGYEFVEFLTHIDLSNTLISEVPTDRFHVSLKLNPNFV